MVSFKGLGHLSMVVEMFGCYLGEVLRRDIGFGQLVATVSLGAESVSDCRIKEHMMKHCANSAPMIQMMFVPLLWLRYQSVRN